MSIAHANLILELGVVSRLIGNTSVEQFGV